MTGQRLLQTVPDTFLGWSSGPDGNDYYVRQLWDMKGGIDAYLGKSDAFDEAIAAFAVTYADVNDRDHQTLAAAVEAGKLQAVNDL